MEENVSFDEINTLICNIKSTTINTRLNALSNIPLIAKSLGRERTENELIPYVMDITDHSPSCLKKISKSLYKLLEIIPDINIKLILDSLKIIGEKEDQDIRISVTKGFFFVGRNLLSMSKESNKAGSSESGLSGTESKTDSSSSNEAAKNNKFNDIYLPYVYGDLCGSDWYPLKCIGSSLLCAFYRKIPKTDHKRAKTILVQLSQDQKVIVRKTVAVALPSLINPTICTILNLTNTNTVFDTSKLSRSSPATSSVRDICTRLIKILSSDKSSAVLIEVPQTLALFAEIGYNDAINNSISKPHELPQKQSMAKNSLSALNEGLEALYEFIVDSCRRIFESQVWQAQSVLVSYIDRIFLLKYRSSSSGVAAASGNHRRRSAVYALINLPKDALAFIKSICLSCVDSASKDENIDLVIRSSIARQISFVFRSHCFSQKGEFESFAKQITSDERPEIRTAAAESIGGIYTSHRSSDEIIPPYVQQMLEALLNDDDINVKLGALKSIAESGLVVDSLIQTINELIDSDNNNNVEFGMKKPYKINWRNRRAIAKLIPKIANSFDLKDNFDELVKMIRILINDDADKVRQKVIKVLLKLASKFGDDWTNSMIVPIINDLYFDNKNDYNLRKTAVEAVIKLRLKDGCKNLLKAAVNDEVPNVRLVLARDLPRSSTHILQKLMKDKDSDVAYFAALKNDK